MSERHDAPWDERNPDWWKSQIEWRGDLAWQWLVNEWIARPDGSDWTTGFDPNGPPDLRWVEKEARLERDADGLYVIDPRKGS